MALELPDYFGHNWDALADLLTDLSWWGTTRGYLILATGWSSFELADPEDAAAAAEVFTAAVGFWAVRDTPSQSSWADRGAEDQNQFRLPPTSASHWLR